MCQPSGTRSEVCKNKNWKQVTVIEKEKGMFIVGAACLLLGMGAGFLFGVWYQANENLLPPQKLKIDFERVLSARWQALSVNTNREFENLARQVDKNSETIFNVPLTSIIQQVGEDSKIAQSHADEVILDAVNFDPKTGNVLRVILKPGQHSRQVYTLLRKARIRVNIDQ